MFHLIYAKKIDYYNALAKKLSDLTTSFKTYWSILKTFCNTEKMPIIPPVLIQNKLEADFFKKVNYFNTFFASKCTPLSNSKPIPSSLDLEAEARLTSINFSDKNILKIKSLDINRVHGRDDISVTMVKICDGVYKNCMKTGIYPNAWEKSNIAPEPRERR